MPTPGLHDSVITKALESALRDLEIAGHPIQRERRDFDELDNAIARTIADLVRKTLGDFPNDDAGLHERIEFAHNALRALHKSGAAIDLPGDLPVETRDFLTWVGPTGGIANPTPPPRPHHGLTEPSLLLNGKQDVQLLAELRREFASATRVDAIIAFLRFSGVKLLEDALRDFFERGGELRLITSTYVGATERRAVTELARIHRRARIRVAYEEDGTRLHAKAWLFHRPGGLSTAYIGSSNMSRSAMTDGAEWNVRVTQRATPVVLERFESAFEQFWTSLTLGDFDPDQDVPRLQQSLQRTQATNETSDFVFIDAEPKPHQLPVLEALATERRHGHNKNLVVAATGTGKTWVSAFDFRRMRQSGLAESVLFVAHRKEILRQSRNVFRLVLQDHRFGEMLVDGERPQRDRQLFASVQSLNRVDLAQIAADHFDVVIMDEFHHAAARTYERVLEHFQPKVLLGLTATPERTDGQSILHWFENRIAAELRLWDALDQGLVAPFHYYGIFDPTSAERAWKRGKLHDGELEGIYTADDARATRIYEATKRYVVAPKRMRAIGFCVGVGHAQRMASTFKAKGLSAVALHGKTPTPEREKAVRDLQAGELQAIFTVDLFNEGIDIPRVDTILFLRPTQSATVFLQQLGRGLRRHPQKSHVTVLDFVGHVHEDFRYEAKFQALVGGTRKQVENAIASDFPMMPPGCAIVLERQAKELVLDNLKKSIRGNVQRLIADLQHLGPATDLATFLRETGADIADVYYPNRRKGLCFTRLRELAHFDGFKSTGPIRNRLGRLIHVDDAARLATWQRWLAQPRPPQLATLDPSEVALARMLIVSVGDRRVPVTEMQAELDAFWAEAVLQDELRQLLKVLEDRVRHETSPLDGSPVHLHASYSRDEVVAAFGTTAKGRLRELREGVLWDEASQTDLFFITLEKSEKQFKPSVRYADVPLSPTRLQWESQNSTTPNTEVGRRYVSHRESGTRVMLFVRARPKDSRGEAAPYTCLGYAQMESHVGEKPMKIVWQLDAAMPAWVLRDGTMAA